MRRSTQIQIGVGLLTLALHVVMGSRVLAQTGQPKVPPNQPVPPSCLGAKCSNGTHIEKPILSVRKPGQVAPTPINKQQRKAQ